MVISGKSTGGSDPAAVGLTSSAGPKTTGEKSLRRSRRSGLNFAAASSKTTGAYTDAASSTASASAAASANTGAGRYESHDDEDEDVDQGALMDRGPAGSKTTGLTDEDMAGLSGLKQPPSASKSKKQASAGLGHPASPARCFESNGLEETSASNQPPATPQSWANEAAEELQRSAEKFAATRTYMINKGFQTDTKTSASRDTKSAGLPEDKDEYVKNDSEEESDDSDVEEEEETSTSTTREKPKSSFYNWLFFGR